MSSELLILLWWIAFLLVWALSCWRLNRLGESHHFWYGSVVLAFSVLPDWLRVLGGIVLVDDAIWHGMQALGVVRLRRYDGDWNDSPLHTAFYHVFKGAP
jgi:hypothetical protein